MKIISDQELHKIKHIIDTTSKYQKVMLVYDDSASENNLIDIYNLIKELCIFNRVHIKDINDGEIYNGYRAIIYFCSSLSILKVNIEKEDFINIYLPTDQAVLPCYIDKNNNINISNSFMFTTEYSLDLCAMTSIYLNKFYNYVKELLNMQRSDENFYFEELEITPLQIIKQIESIKPSKEFIDIKIMKMTNLDYKYLGLVDLMIINSFSLLISSCKNKTLQLADIYKICKNDYSLADKFYSIYTNRALVGLIELNYNCLNAACNKCKEKILEFLPKIDYDIDIQNQVYSEMKKYSIQSNDLIANFYLYDIFSE